MRVGRRCFVSNLAWRTSWQDLKDKFRECGTVVYTNVIRDEGGEYASWAAPPRVGPASHGQMPCPFVPPILTSPPPFPARRPLQGLGHRRVRDP